MKNNNILDKAAIEERRHAKNMVLDNLELEDFNKNDVRKDLIKDLNKRDEEDVLEKRQKLKTDQINIMSDDESSDCSDEQEKLFEEEFKRNYNHPCACFLICCAS